MLHRFQTIAASRQQQCWQESVHSHSDWQQGEVSFHNETVCTCPTFLYKRRLGS